MNINPITSTQSQHSTVNAAPSQTSTGGYAGIAPDSFQMFFMKPSALPATRAAKRKLQSREAAQKARDKAKRAKLQLEIENKDLKQKVSALTKEAEFLKSKLPESTASKPPELTASNRVESERESPASAVSQKESLSKTSAGGYAKIAPNPLQVLLMKPSALPATSADKRKLQGREAAQRSRDKAKRAQLQLEIENKDLKQKASALTEEIGFLKSKLPESTVSKLPESTVSKLPESTAAKPPESTAAKPSELTAAKPPESTAAKPSESTVSKPPESTASMRWLNQKGKALQVLCRKKKLSQKLRLAGYTKIAPNPLQVLLMKSSALPVTRAAKRRLQGRETAQRSRDKAKRAKLQLETENKDLKQKVSALTEEVKFLKSMLVESERESPEGAEGPESTVSQKEYRLLKSKYVQLLEENKVLQQTCEEHETQCIVAFKEADHLYDMTINLKSKIDKLKKKAQELERENTDLLLPATPSTHQAT